MRCSVIIPTFNRASTLMRAIDSVLNQSEQDLELIVIDDGSTDDTAKDLQSIKDSRLKVITLAQNHGVSYARNRGIEQCTSSWIALLDSDDQWHPNKLEKQLIFLESNPELKIAQTQEIWIRKGQRVNAKKKHQKPSGWIFEPCLKLCLVSPSAVIIHRSLFEDVGLFDETLPACEDYDLWLRIALKYPIGLLDEALITKYGGHEDQLSRKVWGLDRFRIIALEKLLQEQDLNPEQKQAVQNELKHKQTIFNQGRQNRGRKIGDGVH